MLMLVVCARWDRGAGHRSVPQTAVEMLLVISFYMNIRNIIGDMVMYVRLGQGVRFGLG